MPYHATKECPQEQHANFTRHAKIEPEETRETPPQPYAQPNAPKVNGVLCGSSKILVCWSSIFPGAGGALLRYRGRFVVLSSFPICALAHSPVYPVSIPFPLFPVCCSRFPPYQYCSASLSHRSRVAAFRGGFFALWETTACLAFAYVALPISFSFSRTLSLSLSICSALFRMLQGAPIEREPDFFRVATISCWFSCTIGSKGGGGDVWNDWIGAPVSTHTVGLGWGCGMGKERRVCSILPSYRSPKPTVMSRNLKHG